MGWTDYFKKAKRERETIFIEFTDKELEQFNKYRFRMFVVLILMIGLSWTGVGLIIFLILFVYYIFKMRKIRQDVYRRYLKKKHKK